MRAGSCHAVAVEQQEIGRAHHVFLRHGAAAVAGAHEQAPPVALGLADALDEFMDARRTQDVVVVGLDVGLVVHLHEHVAPAAIEQPARGVIRGAQHGGLVAQPLVLAEIEVAEDDHHSLLIRRIEHAPHPLRELRTQRAVLR